MTEDKAAPAPFPFAAAPLPPEQPDAPERPDTAAATAEEIAPAAGAGLGPLGMTLIGGAVAAVGLAIAIPFLRRRSKTAEASGPKAHKRGRSKG